MGSDYYFSNYWVNKGGVMSDVKCPFCQQELKDQWVGQNVAHEYFDCPKCKMNGNPKLWQELIRTRKALEIAVDMLKEIDKTRSVANHKIGTQDKTLNPGNVFCWTTPDEIHNALEQITALEQKE